MQTLLQDLRFGARMLLKKPGFTIVAVITLALGIGANTAVFSLINAVLLRPLQFYEPERLVMVWEDASFAGFPQQEPAPANYVDWKARQSVFEDMAALEWGKFSLTGDGEPQQVYSNSVTSNFFTLLGVAPALGRTFSPEEEKPGANTFRRGGLRKLIRWSLCAAGDCFWLLIDLLILPIGFRRVSGALNLALGFNLRSLRVILPVASAAAEFNRR